MICFDCGHNGPYGVETCENCGKVLRVAPPHVDANHISQVQVAIEDYLSGTLERENLLEILSHFEGCVDEFEQRWGPLMEQLFKDRLGDSLKETYEPAAIEIDRALARLVEALSCFQDFAQDGSDDILVQGREELLSFFRLACGGCAILLHELELEQLRQVKLGNAADVSL